MGGRVDLEEGDEEVPDELVDSHVKRVSAVARPATRIPFLLIKAEGGDSTAGVEKGDVVTDEAVKTEKAEATEDVEKTTEDRERVLATKSEEGEATTEKAEDTQDTKKSEAADSTTEKSEEEQVAKADDGDTKKCPKCGAMNGSDAKFCDQCGASMASKSAKSEEADAAKADAAKDTEKSEEAVKAEGSETAKSEDEEEVAKSDEDDGVEKAELVKSGRRISSASAGEIQAAIGKMADLLGADVGQKVRAAFGESEDGKAVEKSEGTGQSEVITRALIKSLEISKEIADGQEEILKGTRDVAKAVTGLEGRVKELEDSPRPGGPFLNGVGELLVMKREGTTAGDTETAALESLAASTRDPVAKDAIGRELAMRMHPAAQSG